MSASTGRRVVYLQEMGVGPLWKRRAASDLPEPNAAAASSVETKPPASAVNSVASSMDWDSLEAAVANCSACGLCRGRTNAVPGAGDRKAAWLFVGEGPGYNEDLQGEPFVGRSGQLLESMMHAMGLRRGDNTYIANIVKCHPTDESGKDRPPTPEESAACRHYLDNQIALIEPEIIIALGRTAAVALLGADPQATLSSLRGKEHHFIHQGKKIPLIATYHPAYLLRNPISKKQAWADLCMAMNAQSGTQGKI